MLAEKLWDFKVDLLQTTQFINTLSYKTSADNPGTPNCAKGHCMMIELLHIKNES